jgi:hypothetical protein
MTAALQSDYRPRSGSRYKIDAVNEVYTETGRWTKFVDTGEPFPINLPISRITPRSR